MPYKWSYVLNFGYFYRFNKFDFFFHLALLPKNAFMHFTFEILQVVEGRNTIEQMKMFICDVYFG